MALLFVLAGTALGEHAVNENRTAERFVEEVNEAFNGMVICRMEAGEHAVVCETDTMSNQLAGAADILILLARAWKYPLSGWTLHAGTRGGLYTKRDFRAR